MRRLTIAAGTVLIAALAIVWWLDDAEAPTAPAPLATVPSPPGAIEASRAAAGPAAPSPAARAAPAPTAPAAKPTVEALQARDARRRDAMGRFQASLLVGLDSCMNAGPGPRAPQRLVLRFTRDERDSPPASGPATAERFSLAAVEPVDAVAGQRSPRESPSWPCFASLVGRTIEIPSGSAPQESSFQEVVALPLPMSVGWAGTPQ